MHPFCPATQYRSPTITNQEVCSGSFLLFVHLTHFQNQSTKVVLTVASQVLFIDQAFTSIELSESMQLVMVEGLVLCDKLGHIFFHFLMSKDALIDENHVVAIDMVLLL